MQAIILAAGYATRLYPLTKDTPKPLLKVAGKPILHHIIKKINGTKSIDKIYVVTNDKFESHFKGWLKDFDSEKPIEILSDGTKSNEDRLGALGDIDFVIGKKDINDDIIVIAGDNLFELSLADVINFFRKRNANVVVLYDVKDNKLARQYGIVEIKNELVVDFEEKPTNPKSTLASTGIYLFPKKTLELIKKYMKQGNNADKSGSFIQWLYKREKVFAFSRSNKWYYIGSLDQLKKADKYYKEK